LCTEDLRVQKALANLLNASAELLRLIGLCLYAYTAMVVFTGLIKTLFLSSGGAKRNACDRSVSSSSHAYGAESSSRKLEQERKES
jgi:hypothetical protein